MIRNIFGWKTAKKIIVFESDDWGSFRFKNPEIRDKYIKSYQPSGWMHYNDCFESFKDLSDFEDVINSVTDKNNRTTRFTFLMNPANPDFKKIKQKDFSQYYFENFQETLSKRKDGSDILGWYKAKVNKNQIEVGFHGREHLNVNAWMQDLKNKDSITLKGFHDNIWGHNVLLSSDFKKRHRSTFKIQNYEELESLKLNIKQGIDLLNDIFKQKTRYFVPPDGPYHLSLNSTLKKNGIEFIGLPRKHQNPLEKKWQQTKLFWLGKDTKESLKVITRNVSFEPASPRSTDWVAKAMDDIDRAFKYKSPAVISTHRANYVSGLNPKNKNDNLKQLKNLLCRITKKWPEAEFLTSSELGLML